MVDSALTATSERTEDKPQGVRFTRKDFQSDEEVRWCPGCGDYTILASVQNFYAEQGIDPSKIVIVSGIGCASRFPYYVEVYGMHAIHGRAPAIATGIAITRPDLQVWVVTGDGDALSIGGNHLIHALRRNINIKILLFNNQIYGLTKGQFSPTSELGKVTKASPFGNIDYPFNPVSLALGAEASFVARTLDMDRPHTAEVLRAAVAHKGAAFVEIYQNCNVFNDKAFELVTGRETREYNQIRLEHNKPVRFGPNGEKGVIINSRGEAEIVDVADVGEDRLVVHDVTLENPSQAFALSRLSHGPYGPTPIGVFRAVERPEYQELLSDQIRQAKEKYGPGDLAALYRQGSVWSVN
jgi:2-oxoglutarate ferredoxin oxidoreductase subunit beta